MSATAPDAVPAAPGKRRLWLIVLLLVLFVALPAGIGVGWYLVAGAKAEVADADGQAKAGKAPPAAIYHALEPAFVVNLADRDLDRYLQVEVQVMTRDASVIPALEAHMPLIRNRLLLLFGQQHADQLRSREDKERLQEEALAELQAILAEVAGKPGIEAVYFTNFVTQ
ncbi:flagellar basal body-associated FliL family protein [Rehaibacterium terrae]|uniref:Flagellar protein FliL n=1 Tax=Rehaibacterium terrae TaxID=1341696 RepID=A0A7W7Y245_9GAMM|nr:flagellar FliL protein [Rehaibacterium terrae]